tara:strand:- start:164 stop:421 length:258 start_codon:yes stop_codon:yes gene_type:complete
MIKRYINNFLITLLIFIIKAYQFFLSPLLKANCRYLPSCSEYSIIALREYGLVRGCYYSLKRILKCHPFGGDGYDPVPKKINKEI